MSDLQTHNLDELAPTTGLSGYLNIKPGDFVHAQQWPNSFGTVMSRRKDEDGKVKCEVLWSKNAPPKIQVQEIKAVSRKLKTTWSVQDDTEYLDSFMRGGNTSRSPLRMRDVEETYERGQLNPERVEELVKNGAKLTMHIDGTVVVNRSEPHR